MGLAGEAATLDFPDFVNLVVGCFGEATIRFPGAAVGRSGLTLVGFRLVRLIQVEAAGCS